MKDSITIKHSLPYFEVTKEPVLVTTINNKQMFITEGISTKATATECPVCGHVLHCNGTNVRSIRDIDLLGHHSLIRVKLKRMRCPSCNYSSMQAPGFEAEHHKITQRLYRRVMVRMNNGSGVTETAKQLWLHPSTVYAIDKEHLKSKRSLLHPDPAKFIGIDEFLLHDGHRYATVVVDLADGRILFMQQGKKKQQAMNFFIAMGDDWMKQVVAVSMDMNAQYDSAFRECYPHIDIVYDRFHLIKLYNDKVLTAIRRNMQRQMHECGNIGEYNLLKGSRFLLLSKMSTLERKDKENHQNNARLHNEYLDKGKSLPPGERIMRVDYRKKLQEILSRNKPLQIAYFLLEQLQLSFSVHDLVDFENGITAWTKLALASGIEELKSFVNTMHTHMDGIIGHVKHPISSGKVEGVNNLIKTIRRKAYGFKDIEYFFLKSMFISRKPKFCYSALKY